MLFLCTNALGCVYYPWARLDIVECSECLAGREAPTKKAIPFCFFRGVLSCCQPLSAFFFLLSFTSRVSRPCLVSVRKDSDSRQPRSPLSLAVVCSSGWWTLLCTMLIYIVCGARPVGSRPSPCGAYGRSTSVRCCGT